MAGSEITDDEWLLAHGIEATEDELHDYIERVGKFFYDNQALLENARIKALECLQEDREKWGRR